MKKQIENYIRSYVLGDITLAQCVDEIYKLHEKEAQTFSLILLAIVAVVSVIL